MEHFMRQFVLWSLVVITLSVCAMNGFLMLVIPRVWYRLPEWLAGRPAYMTKEYSEGGETLYARVIGAALLGGISWMICTSLLSK
jgi:hypothetical protein